MAGAYMTDDDWQEGDSYDSGTDSDTSSDSGTEFIDNTDIVNMTDEQAGPYLFGRYRHAKRRWRRYSNKRVRHVRRKFKRSHYHFNRTGKGHGHHGNRIPVRNKFSKGRGKTRGHVFLTQTDMLTYFKGRGKGHRHGSSGQGFGRKENPKDRNGNVMKCHNCGSTTHLIRNCDQPKGAGKGSTTLPSEPGFHVQPVAPQSTGTSHSAQPASVQPAYATEAARAAGYFVGNLGPPPEVETASLKIETALLQD